MKRYVMAALALLAVALIQPLSLVAHGGRETDIVSPTEMGCESRYECQQGGSAVPAPISSLSLAALPYTLDPPRTLIAATSQVDNAASTFGPYLYTGNVSTQAYNRADASVVG